MAESLKSYATQDQITELNGKIINRVRIKLVTSEDITLNANEHRNVTIPFGESATGLVAVLLIKTPNSAWVYGSVQEWSSSQAVCGFGNMASGAATGTAILGLIYLEN